VLTRATTTLRLLGLRATLPFLFRHDTLPELLRRLDAPGGARGPGAGAVEAAAARAFRPLRLWPTTCLWRALGGYAALRAAGADARFLIGVRAKAGGGGEVEAHAWLERGGKPSLGAPRPEDGYRIAFAWPADPGTLRPPPRMAGLHPSEDAILTELGDGTGVLLDLKTRHYFTLNASGVVTWKLLAGGAADLGAIAAGVAREYPDAEPGAVHRDVEALLAELRREGLVLERAAE